MIDWFNSLDTSQRYAMIGLWIAAMFLVREWRLDWEIDTLRRRVSDLENGR